MNSRTCIGINDIPAHDLPWTPTNFAPWAMDPKRKNVRCRDCDREYRRSRRAAREGNAPVETRRVAQEVSSTLSFAAATEKEGAAKPSHDYMPNPDLVKLWKTVVDATLNYGAPPANLIFYGPSGSGKTAGAQYLADLVQLPFTKVDAASMTDPEAWFGTREIIVEQGVSVTKYVPSAFVQAIQKPGVSFIDEVNRADDEHRNVLLPLLDGTGQVTNPLTGEVVVRHEHHFVIMAGNRGLQFTGTSAVDPAFTTRSLTVEFDYIEERLEKKIAMDETGCDSLTATVFVKFANESRAKAKADPDFTPISTREVIAACRLVARGLERDLAARFAIIAASSPEGGSASIRSELESIWNGVRLTKEEIDVPDDTVKSSAPEWVCPTHNEARVVPGGVSKKTGKPYNAFRACPEPFCDEAEPRKGQIGLKCGACGHVNPPGRVTFCGSCGATLS